MRGLLIGLSLSIIAPSAWAQSANNDAARCMGSDYNAAVSACTALIQSGREPVANIAAHHLSRGVAYYYKGYYDEALADYDQAIALKPDFAGAYNNRGLIHLRNNHTERAIADFTQAIALQPDFAQAYENRGHAYFHKANYDDYGRSNQTDRDLAIADFRAALRLDPSLEGAKSGLRILGSAP